MCIAYTTMDAIEEQCSHGRTAENAAKSCVQFTGMNFHNNTNCTVRFPHDFDSDSDSIPSYIRAKGDRSA